MAVASAFGIYEIGSIIVPAVSSVIYARRHMNDPQSSDLIQSNQPLPQQEESKQMLNTIDSEIQMPDIISIQEQQRQQGIDVMANQPGLTYDDEEDDDFQQELDSYVRDQSWQMPLQVIPEQPEDDAQQPASEAQDEFVQQVIDSAQSALDQYVSGLINRQFGGQEANPEPDHNPNVDERQQEIQKPKIEIPFIPKKKDDDERGDRPDVADQQQPVITLDTETKKSKKTTKFDIHNIMSTTVAQKQGVSQNKIGMNVRRLK